MGGSVHRIGTYTEVGIAQKAFEIHVMPHMSLFTWLYLPSTYLRCFKTLKELHIHEYFMFAKINSANCFTNCKEEAEDSDTYELMLGSETQPTMVHKSFISHCVPSVGILETENVSRWQILNEIMHSFLLKAKQNPRDQYGIVSKCQQEAEVDEEKKEDVEDSREETEHEDRDEEGFYSFHNNPDNVYANIPGDLRAKRRDCFCCKRPPPPPPRNLPGILRQGELHNVSQERDFVMDRSKREHGDGLNMASCREDQETCKEDSEEEHPYSAVKLEESVYDFILGEEEEEEKRTHSRSFIMNRPPAPAPRPKDSLVREENIPFIVQAHRGHTDTVTYSTVKHNIPVEQKELIHLQEQVKRGTISVDEALDRFKQWQNERETAVHSTGLPFPEGRSRGIKESTLDSESQGSEFEAQWGPSQPSDPIRSQMLSRVSPGQYRVL
ncbi:B-cell scaffold protein with ankyrin repeats [Willisornis vidua]|uniref:B-cell scaffold protein with ankyrin repeats n=1 Tax=Willisornis vidua TaxID=1566151 RepID=A0ABQ9CY31_9PASS|nr:B-cell scaffold protein with ankyrin repeats [Willisornis vidua]